MSGRAVLTELLDLVLPDGCAGCGAPGASWCPGCAAHPGPPRLVSGLPGAPPTVAAGVYAGPLRQALLAYKERGRRGLAGPFAGMLASAAPLVAPVRCWLVPVPSRPAAARSRGGDHVRALAEELAERMAAGPGRHSVGVSPALRMRSGGRDSVGLDIAARAANLRGRLVTRAYQLPPPAANVLLVDDVVTTGSTLRACSAALEAADIRVVGAITLCDATAAYRRPPWPARQSAYFTGCGPFGEPTPRSDRPAGGFYSVGGVVGP